MIKQLRATAPPKPIVHARTTNERGQIVPRCASHGRSNVSEMIVTGAAKRVSCAACARSLS